MAARGRKRVAGSAVGWIRQVTPSKPTITDYVFVRSTSPGAFASDFGYGLNLSPNWLVFRKMIDTLGVKLTTAIDPLAVQFHLVHDCIRACVYAEHIGKAEIKKDAWLSLGDMCYSDAILFWSHIFGTNSQQSHWKKLLANVPLPEGSPLKPFGKAMIVEHLKTTGDEWDRYHAKMVEFRNDRIAHFDHGVVRDNPPNITWALDSSCLYREWLLSLVRARQASGRPIKITETTGEAMLALFRAQIEEVCR